MCFAPLSSWGGGRYVYIYSFRLSCCIGEHCNVRLSYFTLWKRAKVKEDRTTNVGLASAAHKRAIPTCCTTLDCTESTCSSSVSPSGHMCVWRHFAKLKFALVRAACPPPKAQSSWMRASKKSRCVILTCLNKIQALTTTINRICHHCTHVFSDSMFKLIPK